MKVQRREEDKTRSGFYLPFFLFLFMNTVKSFNWNQILSTLNFYEHWLADH